LIPAETAKNSLDLGVNNAIIKLSNNFLVKETDLAPQAPAAPVRVEIYDQVYNLRGTDADYILKLAEFVDTKMRSVAEQTATVDSLRLAVLAALNIADEYHLLKKRYEALATEYRQRAGMLAGALDEVLEETRRVG
jgi:cell division protein ZapA